MKKKVVEVLGFSLSGFCFLHHHRLEAKHLVILILLNWMDEIPLIFLHKLIFSSILVTSSFFSIQYIIVLQEKLDLEFVHGIWVLVTQMAYPEVLH